MLGFRWQTTPNGRGQSRDPFIYFALIISLESVKLRTSNFVC